jgi:hypothetical protein
MYVYIYARCHPSSAGDVRGRIGTGKASHRQKLETLFKKQLKQKGMEVWLKW